MGYFPGEEEVESAREDDELVSAVYRDLDTLATKSGSTVYGSTRFDSHGYLAGWDQVPDISILQVKFPEIEFRVTPTEETQPGFHDNDEFADVIQVAYRIKGSKGWHSV